MFISGNIDRTSFDKFKDGSITAYAAISIADGPDVHQMTMIIEHFSPTFSGEYYLKGFNSSDVSNEVLDLILKLKLEFFAITESYLKC